jgi:hypothetical protein
MFLRILVSGLLAFPVLAQAHDWYEVNDNTVQCDDMATFAAATGAPQLATPANTKAFYESLGDTVIPIEVKDESGLPVIVLGIKDSLGNTVTAFTFYPTMSDCKGGLAYDLAHGIRVNPQDLN